jgi:hypothetical protein
MTTRRHIATIRDGAERRTVVLTFDASGAVIDVAAPATNWHAWSLAERAFVARLSAVRAALRQGRGLVAQRCQAEAMLALLEQLEDAEGLAGLPERGRA